MTDLIWNKPEFTPLVEEGKEEQFWIAVENDKGKVFVFPAHYQNRPLDENGDNYDDALEDLNGDAVGSVGWVDLKQHVDYDNFWEALTFNDNYKLLGWAVYTPPEFTGVSA